MEDINEFESRRFNEENYFTKRYFNSNFIISKRYSEEKEKFLSYIKQCKGDEFDDGQKRQIEENMLEVIKVADNISSIILEIFDCYENVNYKRTQELMDGLMSQLEKDIFIGSIDDWVCINCNGNNYYTRFRITPGKRFFRVRAVGYETPSIQKMQMSFSIFRFLKEHILIMNDSV